MIRQSAILLSIAMLIGGCARPRTYADGCGSPPAGWITPRQGRSVMSFINTAMVAPDGTLSWNGITISRPTFQTYLKQTRELNPAPMMHIKFSPAVDCGTVASLRGLMAETLDCRGGKCAEGNGKWWMIGDVVFDGKSPGPYDPDAAPPTKR
jgi:hypothetical protein